MNSLLTANSLFHIGLMLLAIVFAFNGRWGLAGLALVAAFVIPNNG